MTSTKPISSILRNNPFDVVSPKNDPKVNTNFSSTASVDDDNYDYSAQLDSEFVPFTSNTAAGLTSPNDGKLADPMLSFLRNYGLVIAGVRNLTRPEEILPVGFDNEVFLQQLSNMFDAGLRKPVVPPKVIDSQARDLFKPEAPTIAESLKSKTPEQQAKNPFVWVSGGLPGGFYTEQSTVQKIQDTLVQNNVAPTNPATGQPAPIKAHVVNLDGTINQTAIFITFSGVVVTDTSKEDKVAAEQAAFAAEVSRKADFAHQQALEEIRNPGKTPRLTKRTH